MINPKNIAKHELMGLEVEVVESRNKKQIGIRGKVVDETKNMLVILDSGNDDKNESRNEGKSESGNRNREKRIEKKSAKFMFKISGKNIVVDGSLLAARPEDRIKKRLKKW